MDKFHIAILVEKITTYNKLQQLTSPAINVTGIFQDVNQLVDHMIGRGHLVNIICAETIEQQTILNAKKLAIKLPYSKTLVIASYISPQEAKTLIQIRVTGLLLVSEISEKLASTLQSIFLGRVVMSPSLLHNLTNDTASDSVDLSERP